MQVYNMGRMERRVKVEVDRVEVYNMGRIERRDKSCGGQSGGL